MQSENIDLIQSFRRNIFILEDFKDMKAFAKNETNNAAVFKATHRRTNKRYVLKRIVLTEGN